MDEVRHFDAERLQGFVGVLEHRRRPGSEALHERAAARVGANVPGDHAIADKADHVVRIPDAGEFLNAVVAVVPLQLFAYHVAVLKGTDVDQPRNLAKSVTVE